MNDSVSVIVKGKVGSPNHTIRLPYGGVNGHSSLHRCKLKVLVLPIQGKNLTLIFIPVGVYHPLEVFSLNWCKVSTEFNSLVLDLPCIHPLLRVSCSCCNRYRHQLVNRIGFVS